MSNPTTASQWQQAKSTLVEQSGQNFAEYATLKKEGTQLAFQSADLYKQLKVTTDPVQRAQLQAQFDSVQSQLQQNNNKIDQNQTEQARLDGQIQTAESEIQRASSGTPNANATTAPANNEPGSNTQAEPLPPVVTPAVQYSVPPQLRTEVSPIGAGQFSYDVIDTERGKIIKSFDTQDEANAYMAGQGSAPGSTSNSQNQQVENKDPQDTTNPSSANAVNGSDLASDQATTIAAQKDPSSAEYISEADRASDAASQQIAAQKDPSSAEYISEADRASDAASQTIQNQKNPSSAEYVNESDRASDAAAAAAEAERNAKANSNTRGIAPKTNTQSQATQQDVSNFYQTGDWRVRLSLAPGSTYLYNSDKSGILKPLAATNGVLFPYTPSISVQYAAHYDSSDIVHSNYKIFQYKSSSVDQIAITCDFTAQDTFEANYLLAVIHFFRSATKMFYGLDENPTAGTPPPLCYLTGLGSFQFDKHPLAITGFNYSLPTDVDYIRAGVTTTTGGVNKYPANQPQTSVLNSAILTRLSGLLPGAKKKDPEFKTTPSGTPAGSQEPTYVPTKIQLSISAIPIVTRNDISKSFSLAKYGTGELLRGSKRPGGGGGIW